MKSFRAELGGRRALVTGGARGIGFATARLLAENGAEVVLADIVPDTVHSSAEALRAEGLHARAVVMDVASTSSVEAALAGLAEEEGGIGILVNNAGIAADALLVRMGEDAWERVLQVNLGSAYRVSRACVRGMMKARWGRIVNIASVVGQMGNAGQANYAAAKAGMIGMTKALARELAGRGITVNAIAPGFIQTAMTDALPEKARQDLVALIPMGRLGMPEDVATATLFLASDAASYITGHVLSVNGGMYM